jgi:HSP20 family protein
VKEGPEGTMTASFELPGMSKDDVNIELHGDRLTISGETKSSSERTENESYVIRERRFGKFSQSLPVPEGTEVSVKLSAQWLDEPTDN